MYCCMGRRGPMDLTAFERQCSRVQDDLLGETTNSVQYMDVFPRTPWVSSKLLQIDQPTVSKQDLLLLQKPRTPFRRCVEVDLETPPLWIMKCVEFHTDSDFRSEAPQTIITNYIITEVKDEGVRVMPKLTFPSE